MGKGRLLRNKQPQNQYSRSLLWMLILSVISPVMASVGYLSLSKNKVTDTPLHWVDIAPGETTEISIPNEDPIVATGMAPGVIHLKNMVKPSEIASIVKKTTSLLKPVSLTGSSTAGAWRSSKMLTTSAENGSRNLNKRIQAVTKLSDKLIKNATIQVQRYDETDRYLPHFDSKVLSGLGVPTPRDVYPYVGRFLTLVIYLSDSEGGETIFPFSNMPADQAWEYASNSLPGEKIAKSTKIVKFWEDYCECAHSNPQEGVAVKAVAGDAVLFYNHFSTEDGLLGEMNPNSLHGGCVVAKGSSKTMMNYWLNVHPSMFADLPEEERLQPIPEKREPSPSEWQVLKSLCKKSD